MRVTINGYEFRTTVAAMSGQYLIGLNKQVRTGAGVAPGEQVSVDLVLDDEERTVEVPAWIEEAKRSETRQARVAKAATMLRDRIRHP